ncbi:hypothetical protein H6G93_34895 [Nostoc sp. FACHB-973]|nr:hypothetical protein [Nostoc sp. FACHB-973]
MSTRRYANAPFNNLRAVFAIFWIAPSSGFGSEAIAFPTFVSVVERSLFLT